MAAVNKTKNIIDFVRDGSIKWLNKSQNSSHQEFDEMKRSPSAAEKNWIYELSAVANAVVRRCSKVLDVSVDHLRENFEEVASEVTKTPSRYARNFLEYSCFRALAQTTQVSGYMEDKRFRRLTFDMMLAWEVPDVASQPSIDIDEDATVGIEAFSRIAPAVPVIANVIISNYIFEFLTSSTGGRLPFSTFEKYLIGLERAVKKLKSNSESSLLLSQRSGRGERVLELEGTVTTQPVLQHLGISTWPGRLTLTDHALYFEALRVVSYDKPTVYDLADDLKQVVKAELTGPWGSRLFDKAVLYKSNALSEPVILELPELKGHARRDYWLAIVREILYAHRFIRKYRITGVERDEALLKAVFGILRIQALSNMNSIVPLCYEAGLMYNACDQLPGGDRILETIATMLTSKETQKNNTKSGDGMHSVSATTMASSLGFVFGTNSNMPKQSLINVGEITVGEMTPLEKAVEESRSSYKMVADAQATVDGAKVEGLDTNLAVLKELLVPLINLGNRLLALLYWEEPAKSVVFCFIFAGIIYCGWMAYVFAFLLIFFAINMMLARHFSGGNPISELKVTVPPPMNKMEQLLAVQNAISQAEELVQEGNVILLKIHGLLLSIFPQASNRFAAALVGLALFMTIIPFKYVLLLTFLEEFTKYSPMRRAETERIMRRMREWWISIPAAPVVLERAQEDKKKK
ncbi:hypothetical protein HanRHA438_Chr11g0498901 [Helianthus annuus]|uniref:Uncharacterized protein n=1 Tax=Helianthus annuus TaxID=4232 RepID=A0A251TAA5_HELAN|nr:uncharacterized protein LOC110890313 isoform X1 [Helianthus annuus]XP_035835154.1 uncharacterized protein LOC110890313 isoform X1 [Helianthus annuus]XP_035835155.1 uncharacterized protein LOC110890313 isoform X1 [Helianthus annuus]XP_035835156.1 uncharacterized protein LOC110890313 isoform X1 [Helianthus annuus]XP_035835157.1 uncharacterized protein LOC110890313 isoform X1 [Helianthus annuus]XP_035835158.1 uncharacterized protein LOC110890313 isoform X1 [Helianthus annuus]XP_035835159.1 un